MTGKDNVTENESDEKAVNGDALSSSSSTEQSDTNEIVKKDMVEQKSEDNKPVVENSTAKAPKKTNVSWLLLFTQLVVVVALAVGAYFGWKYWQLHEHQIQTLMVQTNEQESKYSQSSQQQVSQLKQLKKQQQQQFDQINSLQNNDQQAIQQRLDAQAEQLQLLSGNNRNNWMLEEVRYLLRLVNQRRLTGGDVSGMVGLLKSADEILHTVDDPDLFPIRNRINKEIIALKLAPSIDREGLYLQLSALIERVDQLPSVPLKSSITPAIELGVASATPEGQQVVWYSRVWSSITTAFGELDGYVRIRHNDKPAPAVLSDMQQSIMQQNLRLMFEQSQLALLREDKVIYQQSLEKVIGWLNQHYQHFPERQALVDQVVELQRQRIVRVLPDTTRSLALLVEHLERYRNPSPQNPTEKAEDKKQETVL